MKLKITSKLILTIGLISVVTLTAMFLLTRLNFQSDFLDYINDQTQIRLENTAELSTRFYEINQSWNLLRQQPRIWRQILIASDLAFREGEGGSGQNAAGEVSRVSISLLDADRRFVVGDQRVINRDNLIEQPVLFRGLEVGFVVAPRRIQVTSQIDQQFATRQLRAGYAIGLAVLVMVLVITAFVVRRMVKPVLELKRGTRMLTDGNFDVRVARDSSDELGELASDFNQLAETLERNRTNQRRWVSDISHELRTPIAILRGEIETMQSGIKPMSAEGLQSLQEEVQRLTRLVDDLYLLSLSDAREISYFRENVDLRGLISEAVEDNQPLAEQAGMQIERDTPTSSSSIFVDVQRMNQVINNLFENSFRYAGAGCRVRVTMASRDGRAIVRIEDDGPGVSREDLPHLFERLYRADGSRNRQFGGSGLGLSICQGIVADLGGTITASRSGMGGLAIEITFPEVATVEGESQ